MVVVGYFEVNQEEITLTKCENRDKPAMKCNGKCYLTKQLKKLDEKQNSKKNTTETRVEVLVCNSITKLNINPPFETLLDTKFQYLIAPASAYLKDIFHPPSC